MRRIIHEDRGADTRRGHIAFKRKVSQRRLDLGGAHVLRVALVVKQDKAARPIDAGAFGADGVMPHPNFTANPVEQARRWGLI